MSASSNPLREMVGPSAGIDTEHERPNKSFEKTALPGFKKTVHGRRAIRRFDGEPIPPEIMKSCLRDAILAPSSSNLQSYELHWTQDKEKIAELAKYCLGQPGATTAGDIIVVVSRVDLWESHLKKLTDIMTNNGANPLKGSVREYYEKITPMLRRTDPFGFQNFIRRIMLFAQSLREPTVNGPVKRSDHRVYGHVQAALAAENLMLSIAAHGYESCPMGGIDKRAIRKFLGLPSSAEVTMVICAGKGLPEGLLSPRTRLPFFDLVKEF